MLGNPPAPSPSSTRRHSQKRFYHCSSNTITGSRSFDSSTCMDSTRSVDRSVVLALVLRVGKSQVNDVFTIPTQSQPEGAAIAWEFQNHYFQQGRPDLLQLITRKPAKPSKSKPATARQLAAAAEPRRALPNRVSNESAASGSNISAPPALTRTVSYPTGSTEFPSVTASNYAPYASAPPSSRPQDNPRLQQRHSLPADYPPAPKSSHPKYFPQPPQFSPPILGQSAQISPRTGLQGPSKPLDPTQQKARPIAPDSAHVRHLAGMDHQIRRLSEALFKTQQEAASVAASSYEALRIILGVVASFDHDAESRTQSTSTIRFRLVEYY